MKKHGSAINVDKNIDNLFLLIYSTSDVFGGLLSYLYYKVLNMDPEEYYNIENENEFYSKEEIDEEIEDYKKYENFNFGETINSDISKIIEIIREDALRNKIIKKIGKYYLIENYDKYNSEYLLKVIYKFYRKGEKTSEIK